MISGAWKWVLIAVGVLAGGLLVMAVVGLFLPRRHAASVALALPQPCDTVWATVRDLGGYAAWWPHLTAVERLDAEGREVWLQRDRRRQTMPVEIVESEAPVRLVTRIVDDGLPFGGTWTFELAETPPGCTLTLTEDGVIHNPLFRFLARFVFGYHGTLESYLEALDGYLGQGGSGPGSVLSRDGAQSGPREGGGSG
jgi:uncharacterized protein YndB with AHSA1/START domain